MAVVFLGAVFHRLAGCRPLIRHGLWPCHLLPTLRQPFFASVGREKRAAALPQPRFIRHRRRFGCRPPGGRRVLRGTGGGGQSRPPLRRGIVAVCHSTGLGGAWVRAAEGGGPYGGLSLPCAVQPAWVVGGDGIGGTHRSRPTEDFVAGCRLCGVTGCVVAPSSVTAFGRATSCPRCGNRFSLPLVAKSGPLPCHSLASSATGGASAVGPPWGKAGRVVVLAKIRCFAL